MKIPVIDAQKKRTGEKQLPAQFSEPYREDIIKRAVLAIQANKRQPYGADPRAGKKASVLISKRRRHYRGSYGRGVSRIPRKVMTRRGTQFNFTAAFAPGTVKGRRSHPPKAEKKWEQKINDKERQKAIRSALNATINTETVKQRNHSIPEGFPFLLAKDFENIKQTKELRKALLMIGLETELKRTKSKITRSGKGKTRGRRQKTRTGPLLVVSKQCELQKAAKNIPGMETVQAKNLNCELLAPGAKPGRLTLYTEEAIEEMEKNKLFAK